MVDKNFLESIMLLVHDTKKEIKYNKHFDAWFWCDRGDSNMYGPFKTFIEAAVSSVEPYI